MAVLDVTIDGGTLCSLCGGCCYAHQLRFSVLRMHKNSFSAGGEIPFHILLFLDALNTGALDDSTAIFFYRLSTA